MRSSWLDDLWVALWEALENIWRKLQLFSIGLLHLFFSSDHRWPRIHDANSHRASSQLSNAAAPVKTRTKRIVFVRHAESEWNVVFNRGVWWLAGVRLLRALVREWLLLPTFDSIFIDSPLSDRGLGQATALGESVALAATSAIEAPAPPPSHWLRYLGSALPRSMVVASNLRRTIDTARIGSAARLEATAERIHVHSCLQEVGRNIDTLAISDAYSLPPRTLSAILEREKHREELFNVSESHGNKAILGCARARLLAFANWTFLQDHLDVLVVYGHSHWFRAFCQEFFPPDYDHPVKTEKLANCGVVTFELQERRVDGRTTFGILPTSFEYIR